MPRTARDQSASGIYHVMIRGINRQDIFEAPEDYRKFIETLASLREVVSEDMQTKICTCHIYAYCIMPIMFQASLIGAEFGKQFRGFAELGVGEQGFLLAGIRYKF